MIKKNIKIWFVSGWTGGDIFFGPH